jgi:hypothetical protein
MEKRRGDENVCRLSIATGIKYLFSCSVTAVVLLQVDVHYLHTFVLSFDAEFHALFTMSDKER